MARNLPYPFEADGLRFAPAMTPQRHGTETSRRVRKIRKMWIMISYTELDGIWARSFPTGSDFRKPHILARELG